MCHGICNDRYSVRVIRDIGPLSEDDQLCNGARLGEPVIVHCAYVTRFPTDGDELTKMPNEAF